MPAFYISDQAEVRSKLKTLSLVSISEDGWIHYYRDEQNGEQWILTSHNPEQQAGGLLILKKMPGLQIDELIQIALTSKDKNDIAGAIYDLQGREKLSQEDLRAKLINELKKYIAKKSSFDKERVRLIIHHCELLDSRNRREIIGKPYTEIEKDAEYFKVIAKEAKTILTSIDKAGN